MPIPSIGELSGCRAALEGYLHILISVRPTKQKYNHGELMGMIAREEESFIFPITIHPDVSG
jgi:hypothetical protein